MIEVKIAFYEITRNLVKVLDPPSIIWGPFTNIY